MTDLSIEQILSRAPVIPVLIIQNENQAVPLARALVAGGLNVIEVTLRTDEALVAISRMRAEVPEAIVGAGTIMCTQDMIEAEEAGAQFAVSPGATTELLHGAARARIPLLPGVATASDIMRVRAVDLTHAKFFPAEQAGGVPMLKAFGGPFPDLRFCPTGGIGPGNVRSYLELPNVMCVGGSWVAPADAVEGGDWQRITDLARHAATSARS